MTYIYYPPSITVAHNTEKCGNKLKKIFNCSNDNNMLRDLGFLFFLELVYLYYFILIVILQYFICFS